MARLGTWSTFDAPTENEADALFWLEKKIEEIGGYVRKVMNPHDFGFYPSFEVDRPYKFEDIDDYSEPEDEEEEKLYNEWDNWTDKANAIETEYCNKFFN